MLLGFLRALAPTRPRPRRTGFVNEHAAGSGDRTRRTSTRERGSARSARLAVICPSGARWRGLDCGCGGPARAQAARAGKASVRHRPDFIFHRLPLRVPRSDQRSRGRPVMNEAENRSDTPEGGQPTRVTPGVPPAVAAHTETVRGEPDETRDRAARRAMAATNSKTSRSRRSRRPTRSRVRPRRRSRTSSRPHPTRSGRRSRPSRKRRARTRFRSP